uniref:THAP domain-containing protein 1 n=1 Tax=Electrophorus electricus TaxID=8005 RepID=A0A4W4H829_ELEEL
MGKSCCAVYCTNRFSKNSELSFYRLPKAKEKRSKWITAIHRNNWNPGTEAWICSSHFVSGKKSDDPLHPDYVPSLFSFTSTTDRNLAVRNLERFLQSQKVSEKRPISRELAATALLNLRSPVSEAEVQTEETYNDITSLHEQIKSLNAECQSLRDKSLHVGVCVCVKEFFLCGPLCHLGCNKYKSGVVTQNTILDSTFKGLLFRLR